MPTENLLTPELLRRVSWEPPHPATAAAIGEALAALGARPWQVAETAHIIADAFVASLQSDQDPSEAAS
jgi:ribonuclease D